MPSCFGLRAQPLAQAAERNDEVALVVQVLRQSTARRAAALGAEHAEFVARDRHADGQRRVAPLGQQRVERSGLQHGAGQRVRADRRAFLEHADRELGLQLLEADRGGRGRRARRRRRPRRTP